MIFSAAAMSAALLGACAGGEHTVALTVDDAVTVANDFIVVRLDLLGALRGPDSAHVLNGLNVVILRVGTSDYRAFSNLCTHAGCGISVFENRRLRCQCHGSEFDIDGTNVVGPAPTPLRRFAVTFDAAARELRIARS